MIACGHIPILHISDEPVRIATEAPTHELSDRGCGQGLTQHRHRPWHIASIGRTIPLLGVEPLVGNLWIVQETSVRIREGMP